MSLLTEVSLELEPGWSAGLCSVGLSVAEITIPAVEGRDKPRETIPTLVCLVSSEEEEEVATVAGGGDAKLQGRMRSGSDSSVLVTSWAVGRAITVAVIVDIPATTTPATTIPATTIPATTTLATTTPATTPPATVAATSRTVSVTIS